MRPYCQTPPFHCAPLVALVPTLRLLCGLLSS